MNRAKWRAIEDESHRASARQGAAEIRRIYPKGRIIALLSKLLRRFRDRS